MQEFYKGLKKEIKASGLGDTNHNPPLCEVTHGKFNNLFSNIQKIMKEKDKSSDNYKKLLLSLPFKYRNDWHRLAQFGAMFIIMINFARRAKEGIQKMTKKTFAKKFDQSTNSFQYVKVKGELTKNNQSTDENLAKGGCISFKTHPNGEFKLLSN